jgi:hypothetical protein
VEPLRLGIIGPVGSFRDAVGGLDCPFSAFVKTTATQAAPHSTVFGGRGLRLLERYDFVLVLGVAPDPTTHRAETPSLENAKSGEPA